MSKSLHCFVCDVATTKYYSLANVRTNSSKKKLVEKLGYLVGDQYMIVITEDDIICRSCANLVNNLDRLEVEMSSMKRVVLRFLEKKYSLDEGELYSQKHETNITNETEKQKNNFLVKKKKAEEELLDDIIFPTDDPKSRIWMQCDKCQYTTNYTSFVKNHVRDQICLDCEAPLKNGYCSLDCDSKEKPEDVQIEEQISNTKTETETMDLIVNNISFLNGGDEGGGGGGNDEAFSIIPDPNMEGKLEMTFNVNEAGEMISLTEEKTDGKDEKPALYLQVVGEDEEDDFNNGNVRQVLTVTNDGEVEMMEVMWNEETNSPVAEIPF